jgi:hypothetical protein
MPERKPEEGSPKSRSRKAVRGITSRDYRDLMLRAIDQGWTVEKTGDTHIKLSPPDGGPFIFAASTSNGGRGERNFKAKLRRAGVVFN